MCSSRGELHRQAGRGRHAGRRQPGPRRVACDRRLRGCGGEQSKLRLRCAGCGGEQLVDRPVQRNQPGRDGHAARGQRNLITSLVTGIAAMSGADATTATNGAIAAVDNNWLATQQIVQMKKELSNAKSTLEQLKVASKWAYISTKQDVLTTTGIGKGLAESGWNDVKGLAEFLPIRAKG